MTPADLIRVVRIPFGGKRKLGICMTLEGWTIKKKEQEKLLQLIKGLLQHTGPLEPFNR